MDNKDKVRLSRERVLNAALDLVDREGLAGISMRKLGAELGVEAMTLYYYFPNKSAILDGLVEQVILRILMAPLGEPAAWSIWLRTLIVDFRDELLRHPRLVPLIATRPAKTLSALQAVEKIIALLVNAGFSASRSFHILNILTTFTVGHVLAEVNDLSALDVETADMSASPLISDFTDLPCFNTAISHGLGQSTDHQDRFDFALNILFTGLRSQNFGK